MTNTAGKQIQSLKKVEIVVEVTGLFAIAETSLETLRDAVRHFVWKRPEDAREKEVVPDVWNTHLQRVAPNKPKLLVQEVFENFKQADPIARRVALNDWIQDLIRRYLF